MFCAISGETPQEPVYSPKGGYVFERRLIEKYIKQNGECPVTKEPLTVEELMPIHSNKAIKPRPANGTSIPSLLSIFQNEWDAQMLETHLLRSKLEETRKELSHALYQHESACRVIARLIHERDEAKRLLANYKPNLSNDAENGEEENNDANDVQMNESEEADTLPRKILSAIEEKALALIKTRKKRAIPEGTSSVEEISSLTLSKEYSGHSGRNASISSLDISNSLILTGGSDKNLILTSKDNGEVVATLNGHTKKIIDVQFIDDAILSASEDKTIRYWTRNEDGFACASVVNVGEPIVGFSVHPIGNLLAVALKENINIVNLNDSEVIKAISCSYRPTAIAFHPDGLLLLAGSADGDIKVWDIKSLKEVATFNGDESTGAVTSISASENGYFISAGYKNGQVKIWDLRKQSCSKSVEFDSAIQKVLFDYSGLYLLVIVAGLGINVYSIKEMSQLLQIKEPKNINSAQFGDYSKSIIYGGADNSIKIYE